MRAALRRGTDDRTGSRRGLSMVDLAAVESDRGSRLPLRADLLRVRASGPGPPWPWYAQQALAAHGLGRGLYLILRRLLRCRPMGGWGYDPVPLPSDAAR